MRVRGTKRAQDVPVSTDELGHSKRVRKEADMTDPENHLIVFKGKNIRRIIHNNEWWFSVVDVISALTESSNSRRYWSDLKIKLGEEEGFDEVYEKIVQLKMEAPDGKMRETDSHKLK